MISKLKFFVTLLVSMITGLVFSQVTVDNNNPICGRFLGFNSTSGIDLPLENNGVRTLFSFENWPGYNNIGPQNNSSRIHFPTDPLEVQADIFSIVQIGDIINPAFQRDWMQVGTTYGAGGDLMYTGIIQDPANAGNQTGGDAVIAWGDNQSGGSGQGPDNFRFLFISNLTSATTGPNSDQGRETMRITPQGNIGMGAIFSNAQQPQNRLEVHDDDDSPQFRLPHTYNSLFAEFHESPDGNLHIASQGGAVNAVAIGFLDGSKPDPIVIGGVPTTPKQ